MATAIAQPSPSNSKEMMEFLNKYRSQIALAVPKHLTPERMVRVAVTAISRTPQLQECTPISILACVIQAAELGLELSGPLGQAYMVPRWNKNVKKKEANFQVGYRGLIDLAMRSGRVDCFPLRLVYTNDFFRYAYGTKQFIKHIPNEGGPPPIQNPELPYPDNVQAVYAVLCVKGSTKPDFEVMTTAQIEAHRRRYSPDSYKGTFSPWLTAWEEMAKKTPCRRLAKRAPVSVEFQTAAVLDEYGEAGISQGMTLSLGEENQDRTEIVRGKLANGTHTVQVPSNEGSPEGEPQKSETEDDRDPPSSDENSSGQIYADEPPASQEQTPAQIDMMELENAIQEAAGDQEKLRVLWESILDSKHGRLWESTARKLIENAGYQPATVGKPRVAPGTGRKSRDF